MRIALNCLGPSRLKAGVGNYAVNLVTELSRLRPSHEFLVIVGQNQHQFASAPNVRFHSIGRWNSHRILRVLWEQFIQPLVLWKHGADILHAVGFVLPVLKTTKQVVTVHDMTHFSHPENHAWARGLYMKRFIPLSIRRTDAVISVSHCTKRDILRFVPIKPQRIHVTYNAPHPRFRPLPREECAAGLKAKYGVEGPFILFVGTLEPRKNLLALVRAFSGLATNHRLVIVGAKGWLYEPIFALVRKLRLTSRVLFMGYVPDDDLPLFYNAAAVFVYPSLYEGFGIPVIEAMACGVPVVTSNGSALVEVAGDAALLMDPTSVPSLMSAINEALTSGDLRARLRSAGLQRAAAFSSRALAEETLSVYDSLATGTADGE